MSGWISVVTYARSQQFIVSAALGVVAMQINLAYLISNIYLYMCVSNNNNNDNDNIYNSIWDLYGSIR